MQDLTYAYDNTGNMTGITDVLNTGSRSFTYDALNRLTSGTGTFGPSQSQVTHNYVYDAIGNILEKAGITYSYTDASHPFAVTSTSDGKTYTYDANGNMLTGAGRTMEWDVDNRLSSVSASGGTALMSYDYTGIRVKKDSPSGITTFPFSGYEDAGGIITKYIKIGNEIVGASKGGEKLFYHNDHLGGVNVITDIWAARVQLVEYDPWGKVSREEGTSDPSRRFTGQQLDPESGLYYYGGRYYDPELGRFISPDPFVGQPSDPQNLNRYSYVENNPVNKIDPSGYKSFWKKVGKFFKTLFSKPGRLFASIAVGVFTGFVLGPAGLGLLSSSWAIGAVAGAAAGATSAGLNGGNPLLGALIGGTLGFIGGGGLSSGGPIFGSGSFGEVGGFFASTAGSDGVGASTRALLLAAAGGAVSASFLSQRSGSARDDMVQSRNPLLMLVSHSGRSGEFFRTGDEETVPCGRNPNVRCTPAGGPEIPRQIPKPDSLTVNKGQPPLRPWSEAPRTAPNPAIVPRTGELLYYGNIYYQEGWYSGAPEGIPPVGQSYPHGPREE